MTTEFWIQMVVYAITIGIFAGTVRVKLNYLEKKMDKHNCLMERMARAEQSTKSAHHRLDRLEDEIDNK